MKEGSLIMFEESTSGWEVQEDQQGLFPSAILIDPGFIGLICKIKEANNGRMLLAEILIGNSVICDIDLNKIDFFMLS